MEDNKERKIEKVEDLKELILNGYGEYLSKLPNNDENILQFLIYFLDYIDIGYVEFDEDPDSLIGKLKNEIAEEVIEQIKDNYIDHIIDVAITFIESDVPDEE